MIQKEQMRIVKKTQIALDTYEFILENEYISKHAVPGQFLYIAVREHTLRRPVSIANVNQAEKTITVLFKVLGSGTETLSKEPEDAILDVLGPNGNGFTLDYDKKEPILLIGGVIGIPPLYYLGRELKAAGHEIITVLGYESKDHVFYEAEFKELGETIVTTDDGSYGKKGFVTDVCKELTGIGRYYTCGPAPMIRAVIDTLPSIEGYISLEERMGCGIGACYACVVKDENDPTGYFKICEDGPVFLASEVTL